jgi:hypothetical protein
MHVVYESRGQSWLFCASVMLVEMCLLEDKKLAALISLVCATKIGDHEGYILLHKRTYVKIGSKAFDEISLVVASNMRIIFDSENETAQALAD